MSTKTSIKRVALVAAAALMTAGFSAVTAHAADNTYIFPKTGDGASYTSVTGAGNTLNGVAGPANFVQIGLTAADNGIITVSSTTGSTILSASDSTVAVAANGLSATATSSNSGAYINVSTPAVGSITVSYFKNVSAGVYASTATESIVITVNATASSGVYSASKSHVYIVAGGVAAPSALATADPSTAIIKTSAAAAAAADSSTAAATIQVFYADALGNAISTASDSVTAIITSGPGVLNGNVDSSVAASDTLTVSQYSKTIGTTASGHNGYYTFLIWPNGQVGVSTITIKNAAGTVLATKSVTFAGTTVASIKVTNLKSYVLNSNTATKSVFAVNLYDSAGLEITGYSGTHIKGAVATGSTVGAAITCDDAYDTTDGYYTCSAAASTTQAALTTDASETYTFTSTDGASTTTATGSVKFVSGVLTAVTVAGPSSADPGSKVTYTLTATGANGAPLPDGAYSPGAIFTNANPALNASATAIPFGKDETITLAAGVATDYTYAPYGGSLTASWTLAGTLAGSAVAVSTTGTPIASFASAGIAKALVGTTVAAADVAVNGSADASAATDAANAATDAANAAADAADNATQAASEALAAVNSLATTVASLIAGIKAQITSLTNLITKIKNKVGA